MCGTKSPTITFMHFQVVHQNLKMLPGRQKHNSNFNVAPLPSTLIYPPHISKIDTFDVLKKRRNIIIK